MRHKRALVAVILSAFWLASASCGGSTSDSEDDLDANPGSGGNARSGGGRATGGGSATGGGTKTTGGGTATGGGRQAAGGGTATGGGRQAAGGGTATGGGRQAAGGGTATGGGRQAAGGGTATGGGSQAAGGGAAARVKPPCLKDPSQVAMTGDSYVAAPSYIGKAIVAAAVADRALASGQSYQDLSVPGTTVNSGQIPGQLDSALAKYPKLKTLITDGCGNDIIFSVVCLAAGSDKNSACTDIIQECITNFKAMGQKAKAAGATDVIIFQYPDNVPIGGADILKYGVEEGRKAAAAMTTADFRSYVVDVAPLMKDHPDWYSDALIHVNSSGAKLIGDAIYKLMKDNCIAQPESSGCCQPW